MELSKNERSILAFFPSSTKAQKAVDELQNSGLVPDSSSIQLDRISRYGITNDSDYNNPINNSITLSGPTLFSNREGIDDGANPLLAASDSASGYGNPDGTSGGQAFQVTLLTSPDKAEQAVQIIKANGGKV